MKNNFDNTLENNEQKTEQPVYTDPNADVQGTDSENTAEPYTYSTVQQNGGQQYGYGQTQQNANQQYTYSQAGQNDSQQYHYQQQYTSQNQYQDGNYQPQYQDNYNYNVGNNTGYQKSYDQMDTTPMSMGDWVLTMLVFMIPCAGIVLYFVWAFGKNGNVNRRNYCRASLAITGVVLVIYIIFAVIFGIAMAGNLYY